jgi:hypothetical protein
LARQPFLEILRLRRPFADRGFLELVGKAFVGVHGHGKHVLARNAHGDRRIAFHLRLAQQVDHQFGLVGRDFECKDWP